MSTSSSVSCWMSSLSSWSDSDPRSGKVSITQCSPESGGKRAYPTGHDPSSSGRGFAIPELSEGVLNVEHGGGERECDTDHQQDGGESLQAADPEEQRAHEGDDGEPPRPVDLEVRAGVDPRGARHEHEELAA